MSRCSETLYELCECDATFQIRETLWGLCPWKFSIGEPRPATCSRWSAVVAVQSLSCATPWSPRGPQPAGPLRPWDSPGKNTAVAAIFSPGDPPDPGIELASLVSPALAGRLLATEPPEKPKLELYQQLILLYLSPSKSHQIKEVP